MNAEKRKTHERVERYVIGQESARDIRHLMNQGMIRGVNTRGEEYMPQLRSGKYFNVNLIYDQGGIEIPVDAGMVRAENVAETLRSDSRFSKLVMSPDVFPKTD